MLGPKSRTHAFHELNGRQWNISTRSQCRLDTQKPCKAYWWSSHGRLAKLQKAIKACKCTPTLAMQGLLGKQPWQACQTWESYQSLQMQSYMCQPCQAWSKNRAIKAWNRVRPSFLILFLSIFLPQTWTPRLVPEFSQEAQHPMFLIEFVQTPKKETQSCCFKAACSTYFLPVASPQSFHSSLE